MWLFLVTGIIEVTKETKPNPCYVNNIIYKNIHTRVVVRSMKFHDYLTFIKFIYFVFLNISQKVLRYLIFQILVFQKIWMQRYSTLHQAYCRVVTRGITALHYTLRVYFTVLEGAILISIFDIYFFIWYIPLL